MRPGRDIPYLPRLIVSAAFLVASVFGSAVFADDQVRFQRSNHLVSDLDQAFRVYRDVLGLKLEAVRALPRGGYAYDLFQVPATATLRFAVFSSPSQKNILALTEVKEAGELTLQEPFRFPRVAIVIESPDFDNVINRAMGEGLMLFDENAFVASDGRRGRQRGFHDHDGNLIVVYKISAETDK